MHISREDFERIVAQAIEEIPEEFKARLENLEIVVEAEPLPEHFDVEKLPPDITFLGLYHGLPRPQRSALYSHLWPDHIIIYKGPIERYSRNRRELIDHIRATVRHEIAHYFGITEARLREMGR